ncbi:general stress protein [Planctomonas psychrotolerans]|uniref:general stress protein n=1 Tax=Planctomonas psychrotolerans TaxID=2528712 RepID=UPI001D0D755E|nr:general stress protein [Planctomonas psychrotolerans]
MTNPLFGRGRSALPTIPRGEAVATYDTYAEAQAAVDTLAKADFPVKQVSIVGNDLKTVERVTGKLTYAKAAGAGAASGAWLGLFFGLVLFLFSGAPDMSFVFAAALIGAGFGMIFSIVSYSISRRRRDFTSIMQVISSTYSILVEPDSVNRARNVLGVETPYGTVPAPVVTEGSDAEGGIPASTERPQRTVGTARPAYGESAPVADPVDEPAPGPERPRD